jgi:hypothetical protein
MKSFRIQKILFLALPCLLSACVVHAAPKSLCGAGENVYFSCELGKKNVSLCASGPSVQEKYLEYRFGTRDKVEMKHTANANTSTKFRRTEITYASNSSSIIWFRNNEFQYLLHFPMRGGPVLEVKKGPSTVAEMSCKQGWENTLGDPDAESDFIVTKPGGGPADLDKLLQEK